jgi:hypothetical protein
LARRSKRKRTRRDKGARDLEARDRREAQLAKERDRIREREVNKHWVHVWRGGAPQ